MTDHNSKIFFYYVDHGAPGFIGLPLDEKFYADDLWDSVEFLHKNKLFSEYVIYMEACFSGTMFDNFDYRDLNVYALTSTNISESAYGVFCPPHDDIVDGTHLKTCLGDEFSVNWLADAETVTNKTSKKDESLLDQYAIVRKATNLSHVLIWGDPNIGYEPA